MIDLLSLCPGERVFLREEITAELVENMEDGQWVQVRYLDVPGKPAEAGSVELVHSQDVLRRLEEG